MIVGATVVDLSPEIIVDYLRARSMIEATAVIDAVSTHVAEAQRFANARFREAMGMARRSQRLGATWGDSM